ncbi:ABC transporter substrate-binding protein [Pigmentibacter sp. JX0631]|uniref:ABC transporter substrate-binding protein n=1 Tax=Pigmentibacter sp. JX0631 TaxID=2976982 RepID=UPI002468A408|nr:ABC transporter substrate-binding protein [Pigmentibacter sp. JX0631]WGL60772.1 ABC transporter substrate-binding protein [Pigmentibacter sp. JX0631]
MKFKILIIAISIFFTNYTLAKNVLNIMVHNCDKIPYEFDAPSNVKDIVYFQVLNSLLEVKNGVLQPKLLKNAYYDYQNKEYILEMHTKTFFHNGRLATLDDLEFSILKYYFAFLNKGSGLENILGINKIAELKLKKFQRGVVEGIKQEFPNKLKIKLETPDPDFLYKFTEWKSSLVPIEEMQDNYMDWKTYPIGAGPFKVTPSGFQNGLLQLKKYDQTIITPVDKINIYTKFTRNVEYDISINDIHKGFKEFYNKIQPYQLGITFINANELGNNINFRKFVQAAINSKDLEKISKVFRSVYVDMNQIHNETSTWGTKYYTTFYNPELAKEYFEKIPKHLLNKEWLVTIFSGTNEIPSDRKYICAEIKKILESYGFKIKFATFSQQIIPKKLADSAVFDVGLYRHLPFEYLTKYTRLLKDSRDIYPRPLFDPVLENFYADATKAKTREEKYLQVNKLSNYIHEKGYWIPLLEGGNNINFNPKTIKKLSENEDDLLFLKVDEIVFVK